MPDVSPRRPGRPRDAEREAAILDAAADLLAEVGYDRLSFEAVASRAGASRATLYRRWGGRAELAAAAMRRTAVNSVPRMDTGSLRGDLLALLRWYAGDRFENKTSQLAGLVHAIRRDLELRAAVIGQLIDINDTTVTGPLVQRARDRGELTDHADAALLTEVLTAQLQLRGLVLAAPLDDAWIQRTVDRILLPVLRTGGDAQLSASTAPSSPPLPWCSTSRTSCLGS